MKAVCLRAFQFLLFHKRCIIGEFSANSRRKFSHSFILYRVLPFPLFNFCMLSSLFNPSFIFGFLPPIYIFLNLGLGLVNLKYGKQLQILLLDQGISLAVPLPSQLRGLCLGHDTRGLFLEGRVL